MQYTLVSKLSGGEKRRLHLVTILMRSPNFLILDEPTNDLDILTLNVLEEYLASFPGCILMVSHDRFFLDKLSDHLFVFEGEGRIKDFPGNYSEYKEWRIRQDKLLKKTAAGSTEIKTPRNKPAAAISKLTFKEKIELEQLENDLEKLYDEKSYVELILSGAEQDPEAIRKHSERFGEILSDIDEKEMRWLELNEKVSGN
jgi:ATP-binding cassette subfamily F protein uup